MDSSTDVPAETDSDQGSESGADQAAGASSEKAASGALKKVPAKKAVANKGAAKKTAANKSAAKKAAAKKVPAKKSAARKAVAKASAKKASTVKKSAQGTKASSPAKPSLKKAAVKKAVAKAASTRPVAPTKEATVKTSAPTKAPSPAKDVTDTTSRRATQLVDDSAVGRSPAAIVFSVTEEMLNDLLPFLVGEGIPVEPMDTTVSLPGMGDVEARLGLTVTAVQGVLDPAYGNRVKVIVYADGEVGTRTADFEGDTVGSIAGAMLPNARIPVIGEALVSPFMILDPSGAITVGIDLAHAEFVSLKANQDAPAPDGVDSAAWPGMVAMFGVLLGGIGADLFGALSEHVGDAMVEVDESIGSVFVQLGGRPGPLDISIATGLVTVSLPAQPSVQGRALPVPIAGKRVGIGLATSVVDQIAQIALVHAAGDIPLPFELEVSLQEQSVGSRMQNTRVLPDSFPDLRGALRTEVRTRLLRGQLELSVQSAWLEMPSIVPSFVNQISKRIGGLVSLAPFKVRFPAIIQAPLPDDAGSLPVKLDDLRVNSEGIGLVASLA